MTSLRRFLPLLALLVCGPATVRAQVHGWQAHTSYRSVQTVSSDGELIWAATRGGVFSFDPVGGEVSRYSVVDGLSSVETRTLAADPARGMVWVGYGTGVLDRLNPETGAVTTFRDIERATQFASRGINAIAVRGDSLLISTEFGVVVFDPVKTEVRDAYTRLGTFSAAISVSDVTVAPGSDGRLRIWAATAEGLAWAPLASANLQDPASWTSEDAGFMTANDDATTVGYFDGRLYVGTTTDLYVRTPGGTYNRQFVTSAGITDMKVIEGRLLGSDRFNLFVVEPGGQARSVSLPDYQDPVSVAAGSSGVFWVGDAAGGLLAVSVPGPADTAVSVTQVVEPEGPSEGQFSDLAIGPGSTLWAGGSTASGAGFHRLSADGTWTTFSGANTPVLEGTSRYSSVYVGPEGTAWFGTEGYGVVSVEEGDRITLYNQANSSLAPAAGTADFIIVGGVSGDDRGALWTTTIGSGSPLHRRGPDGTWTSFGPYVGGSLTVRSSSFGRIVSDSFDQKWIIVRNENNFNLVRGLLVVDPGSSATDQSDDDFRFFDTPGAAGVGLPSTTVTSVVEDRDGLVWIGTSSGIAFFINTGIVARDQSARAIWPQWADRSQGVFVLFGLEVNDLAVDPANRLWVATNEGAWLIESVEGGYRLVEHFTAANSPLFSDEVLSIAVDPADGRVFMATDRGLLSYQGDAIAPVSGAGDLLVYPNPVREGDSDIFIEGLQESTDIRIVTPSGDLMAAFSARGGRARWNGLDRNGRPVPSGMYLVIAVSSSGGGTSYGKVAVIR